MKPETSKLYGGDYLTFTLTLPQSDVLRGLLDDHACGRLAGDGSLGRVVLAALRADDALQTHGWDVPAGWADLVDADPDTDLSRSMLAVAGCEDTSPREQGVAVRRYDEHLAGETIRVDVEVDPAWFDVFFARQCDAGVDPDEIAVDLADLVGLGRWPTSVTVDVHDRPYR